VPTDSVFHLKISRCTLKWISNASRWAD